MKTINVLASFLGKTDDADVQSYLLLDYKFLRCNSELGRVVADGGHTISAESTVEKWV